MALTTMPVMKYDSDVQTWYREALVYPTVDGDALCAEDVAALRQIAGTVKAAAIAVARDTLPAGAKQPAEVRTLQGDLANLADAIRDPAQQDGVELTGILAGVHPIVEKLMEAAGMPHVHENEKPSHPPGKEGKS